MDAEVVVIGAGVVGLWTAYHLASNGVKVILLEQFPFPHTRGSSNGQSRIIRTAYMVEEYAALMPKSYEYWRELQKQVNRSILVDIMFLSAFNMDKCADAFHKTLEIMKKYEPAYEEISVEKVPERFPGLRYESNYNVIPDKGAGLLKADSCLLALQEMFERKGGIMHDREGATSIIPMCDSEVQVYTTKRSYQCNSVVLACGTYINKLLKTVNFALPIQPARAIVQYWTDLSDDMYSLENKFPTSVKYLEENHYYYSIPSYEYPGLVKICYHSEIPCEPYKRDFKSAELKKLERENTLWLKQQIACDFTHVDAFGPAIEEISPDGEFILDSHPKHNNIVFGAGFSGRGFMTAPAVGLILANMALGLRGPYPLRPFKLSRFNHSKL